MGPLKPACQEALTNKRGRNHIVERAMHVYMNAIDSAW